MEEYEKLSKNYSNPNLKRFFKNTILKEMLSKIKIDINLDNKEYVQIYDTIGVFVLPPIVAQYIRNKNFFFEENIYEIIINTPCPKDPYNNWREIQYEFMEQSIPDDMEIKYKMPDIMYTNMCLSAYITLWQIICVKKNQIKAKQQLEKKLKKIVTKFSKDGQKRFKWQILCSPQKLNKLDTKSLYQLAEFEEIENPNQYSRRELCIEFAKRFENIIKNQVKIVDSDVCINVDSISGSEVKDIPPEFFYTYNHNNKTYCEDIRSLVNHIKNSGPTNPYDNTQLSKLEQENINKTYKKLKNTVNQMEDYEPLRFISVKTTLTQKMTELSNKMMYPKNIELFINAEKSLIDRFINELVNQYIISQQEKRILSVFTDLFQYKLKLVEMLLYKVDNDPEQILVPNRREPLSNVAVNLTNIFNEIF